MVHTRLLRKFAVERHVREKSAHVGCHGLVALWGSLVGGLVLTRSSQQQPRAAQSSPGEPRRARRALERAQGNPKHLHYDTFPGEAGLQVFPCKPRLSSPRAPSILKIGSLTRKKEERSATAPKKDAPSLRRFVLSFASACGTHSCLCRMVLL